MRRFFHEGFQAADIAQYLVSYDASRPAALVRERMEELEVDIAAIRDDGFVVGYVRRGELDDGRCSGQMHACEEERTLASDARLHEAIARVDEFDFVFVTAFGDVGGIVSRADLQKPPVRMWLFGLITVLERAFAGIMRTRFPNEAWREHVSRGRQELAEKLLGERLRRNESVDVVDCFQFSDKALVALRDETVREKLSIPSMRAAKQAIKELERLRNALAHSQDIVAESWPTVLALAGGLDTVLGIYDGG